MGISLDTKRNDWLGAVKKHEVPWETFCDLKGNDSMPFRIFDSDHIPYLVLLDTQGKLIAVDLTVEQLKNELETIFGF